MNEAADRAHLRAVIRGRVQGVGFRWWVTQIARDLELVGRVGNRPDGTVLLMAEGHRERLEDLAERLHRGPRHAAVVGVESRWSEARKRWKRFAIDHTY